MAIYLNKNGQQSGPFDDDVVRSQLQSGQLSPSDMAIRQGDATWQTLGVLFPDVVRPSAAPAAVGNVVAAEPAKSGGCRVVLGVTMLVVGLMMTVGGAGFAATVPFVYSMPLCPIAEEDYAKLDGLKKKYDAAKNTPDEYSVEFELKEAIDSYDSSSRLCAKERGTRQLFIIGGVVVAIVGFFTAIIGFFLRRVRRV